MPSCYDESLYKIENNHAYYFYIENLLHYSTLGRIFLLLKWFVQNYLYAFPKCNTALYFLCSVQRAFVNECSVLCNLLVNFNIIVTCQSFLTAS